MTTFIVLLFLGLIIGVKYLATHAYRQFADSHSYILEELGAENETFGPQDFRFHWYFMTGRFRDLERGGSLQRLCKTLRVVFWAWYAFVLVFLVSFTWVLLAAWKTG